MWAYMHVARHVDGKRARAVLRSVLGSLITQHQQRLRLLLTLAAHIST